MPRLNLVTRLALLSAGVVAVAVLLAMYAAWRTADRRLTDDIDTDLLTQVREWDRLVTASRPRDTAALVATATTWVSQQQDHPVTQVQVAQIGPASGTSPSATPPGTLGAAETYVANESWRRLAERTDPAAVLAGDRAPHEVRLPDGSAYRVAVVRLSLPDGARGVVAVADSIDTIAAARAQLARDTALVGLVAMLAAALLAGAGSRLLTRRLGHLATVAETAGEGDLTVRAGAVGGSPEVRHLAEVLDGTLDRIERTFAGQQAFIADASHELRTPLAVLRAQAELVRVDGVEAADTLVRQVDATSRLVDDLLTLATGDAAPESLLRRREIDLLDHVEDLRRDLPLLGDRRFVVTTDAGFLVADPVRLDRVIRNLVANAVAHTPRDGRIEVAFRGEADRLRITVSDNGSGMPREVLDRVFERFARGPRGSATGGAGLGMPLAQTLVHAHGGTIAVDSAPGEGTVVTILLPGYRPPHPAATPHPDPAVHPGLGWR